MASSGWEHMSAHGFVFAWKSLNCMLQIFQQHGFIAALGAEPATWSDWLFTTSQLFQKPFFLMKWDVISSLTITVILLTLNPSLPLKCNDLCYTHCPHERGGSPGCLGLRKQINVSTTDAIPVHTHTHIWSQVSLLVRRHYWQSSHLPLCFPSSCLHPPSPSSWPHHAFVGKQRMLRHLFSGEIKTQRRTAGRGIWSWDWLTWPVRINRRLQQAKAHSYTQDCAIYTYFTCI